MLRSIKMFVILRKNKKSSPLFLNNTLGVLSDFRRGREFFKTLLFPNLVELSYFEDTPVFFRISIIKPITTKRVTKPTIVAEAPVKLLTAVVTKPAIIPIKEVKIKTSTKSSTIFVILYIPPHNPTKDILIYKYSYFSLLSVRGRKPEQVAFSLYIL